MEVLAGEKETLGFYITGHPLSRFSETLAEFASSTVDGLEAIGPGDIVRVGGMVGPRGPQHEEGRPLRALSARGRVRFREDRLWPETYKRSGKAIDADAAVLVVGRLERTDDGATSIVADEIAPLDHLLEREARSSSFTLPRLPLPRRRSPHCTRSLIRIAASVTCSSLSSWRTARSLECSRTRSYA